ncbi:hypothetical protein [Flavobacterium haoranii]|uniref:Uncharacterized protein n=1 Tax=Flavobacterium haoranii TaxID=683124 RepID=A0A1M6CL34_9FLAO|nr:hypothetical protein [Flavobacterium haoranii]SHI61633.1 hypothetical protein SAMN05444337_0405 [Flavobacterium haoranii]
MEEFCKKKFTPDLVLQFSGGAYEEFFFFLSFKMASKFNIPRYIHSYDPLPGSTDWGENEIIRKATIKILKKYFKNGR